MSKKQIEKRYCEKCGLEMNVVEYSDGFDRYTGEERPWVRYTCPTLNWEDMMKNDCFMWGKTFMGHYYFSEKLYE